MCTNEPRTSWLHLCTCFIITFYFVFNHGQKWLVFFPWFYCSVYKKVKSDVKVQISDIHSVCVYWYLWVYVFVIESGCGAFIAPSWFGTIALFCPMSPEGGSSIRRSRHSVCQQGLVWDWVSTATWSSEHRNAIVPPSRLWPDQTHMQTHTCT